MDLHPLKLDELYKEANSSEWSFQSTNDIKPLNEIIGQDRAKQAVSFAMSIREKGYNIYAVGRNGLGKRTMVMRYLKNHHENKQERFDWCYIANFKNMRSPLALSLPIGKGQPFKTDIQDLMIKLVKSIPLAFENELYLSRVDKLKIELNSKQETEVNKIKIKAKKQNIELKLTQSGDYQFTALNGDKPHTEETFELLSEAEKNSFDEVITQLEGELRSLIRSLTEHEEKYSNKLNELDTEITKAVLDKYFIDYEKKYTNQKDVIKYLEEMKDDIVKNLDLFTSESPQLTDSVNDVVEQKIPRRYQVNLLVANQKEHYPVIIEDNPHYHSLFGYIENSTFKGTVFTDFTLIQAGNLHKANGGVLLMDANKVLERPYVWDGIKRSLRTKSLNFSSLEREVTLTGTVSLDPEAIPLNVKIILFGDYQTYNLLQQYDPEFHELFQVMADFEDEMDRNINNEYKYAQFISSIVKDNQLLDCDQSAIKKIIEHSARKTGDQNKLSLHSAEIASLLREVNYWAQTEKANIISESHVLMALKSQELRASKIKDEILNNIKKEITLLDLEGYKVGQVNALSVMSTPNFSVGAPSRITATISFGEGEIIDIERDVELGGNIHSKGVMILTAFINSLFGKNKKVPLKTSLAFEQSYYGVDGDSASIAECCAILSSFSNIPLRQDIALTGSMNQFGYVQAIGGVNEKIEGFYNACHIKNTGRKHGVIIPKSNQHNLMLNEDVRQAVKNKQFFVYPVEHISEVIDMMMSESFEHKIACSNHLNNNLMTKIFSNIDEISKLSKGN